MEESHEQLNLFVMILTNSSSSYKQDTVVAYKHPANNHFVNDATTTPTKVCQSH